MTDRSGNEYQVLTRREMKSASAMSDIQVPSRDVLVCILSPGRQDKKARKLSGRQEKKWRKAQRRAA